MQRGMLVYEDQALTAWWIKFLLGGLLVLTLILGFVFLRIDKAGAGVIFGVTVFDGLLFYCVMPRKYQIYSDRLVIVLGGPFTKTVKLSDIKSVSRVAGSNALGYNGLRFSSSTEYVVQILRYNGMGVVISPSGRDYFIDQLNQAVKLLPKS
jgi:hypothetical protein